MERAGEAKGQEAGGRWGEHKKGQKAKGLQCLSWKVKELLHMHREKLEETDGQLTLTWYGQGRPPGESDTRQELGK